MSGHTYTESAEAVVVDTDDPEQKGRVKVKCGAVAGDDEVIPFWIDPLPQFAGVGSGMMATPDVGDVVELEYTTGSSLDASYGQSFLFNPRFRYRAKAWSEKQDVPDDFQGERYGKVAGLATKSKAAVLLYKDAPTVHVKAETVILGGPDDQGDNAVLGTTMIEWQRGVLQIINDLLTAVQDIAGALAEDTLVVTVTSPTGGTAVHNPLTVLNVNERLADIDDKLVDLYNIYDVEAEFQLTEKVFLNFEDTDEESPF
jgi:hypothetical protein